MSAIALLPRILGTLFYYSPTSEEASASMEQLDQLPELLDWSTPAIILEATDHLCGYSPEELSMPFSILFEGQGPMAAPPWGSIYLDKENLLLGETTLAYRQFLTTHKVELDTKLNEPEDQFGLMILAMAYFMEAENDEAVEVLLSDHLIPWASRYLELLANADESGFYSSLSIIAGEFLSEATEAYEVAPKARDLYR
ncbi:molecular chaperone TorD family protein [uncultured Endozoicomonas sp.]|uniref:molecular chaperone TorD family protein n=1 Tax=uncultured Endozoicomonas sp. TaxID=432652 RepID=UPI002609DFD2|nr:molecular chaperone TorD family protein [uncultured Endozoicomonas sp.]